MDRHVALPVILYIPNLMGYLRIICALWGLYESTTHPTTALFLWLLSSALDMFDGPVARKLNQCSQLGIVLDVAADNVLRMCTWMSAVVASNGNVATIMISCVLIAVEWMTLLSTQLHSAMTTQTTRVPAGESEEKKKEEVDDDRGEETRQQRQHWKAQRDSDDSPWIVKEVFRNNFRSPLGLLCMYGLFSSGMWTYGYYHIDSFKFIPLFDMWRFGAYAGRLIALRVELWLCSNFIRTVIANDEHEKRTRDRVNSNTVERNGMKVD